MRHEQQRETLRFVTDLAALAELVRRGERLGSLPDVVSELHSRAEEVLEFELSVPTRADVAAIRDELWELYPLLKNALWRLDVPRAADSLQTLAESLKETLDDEDGSEKAEQEGLDVVRRALHAVRAVPPVQEPPEALAAQRGSLRSQLDPLLPQLAHLRALHLPNALLVSPCSPLKRSLTLPQRARAVLAEPWLNLLECPRLCGRCRGEAQSALIFIEETLRGRNPAPFLAPEVIAARNEAAAREADSWNREQSDKWAQRKFPAPFIPHSEVLRRETPEPSLVLPAMTRKEEAVLRILAEQEPHLPLTSEKVAELLSNRKLPYTEASGIRSRMIPKFKKLGLERHGRRGYSFSSESLARVRKALDPSADEMRTEGGS